MRRLTRFAVTVLVAVCAVVAVARAAGTDEGTGLCHHCGQDATGLQRPSAAVGPAS